MSLIRPAIYGAIIGLVAAFTVGPYTDRHPHAPARPGPEAPAPTPTIGTAVYQLPGQPNQER